MKKIFLSMAILLLGGMAFANKSDREAKREARKEKRELKEERREIMEGVVAYQTEEQFPTDFPAATNVVFERSKQFDEVEFTLEGKNLQAFYDIHGQLVGTTSLESFSDLPASAQKEILKKYNGYDVKEVIQFHDNQFNNTDMVIYGVQFDDADNWFVRLQKNCKDIVLKVSPVGVVSYYTQMK